MWHTHPALWADHDRPLVLKSLSHQALQATEAIQFQGFPKSWLRQESRLPSPDDQSTAQRNTYAARFAFMMFTVAGQILRGRTHR